MKGLLKRCAFYFMKRKIYDLIVFKSFANDNHANSTEPWFMQTLQRLIFTVLALPLQN